MRTPVIASTPVLVGTCALLWTVVGTRFGLVLRPGPQRSLWLTLVTITGAHTLQIPRVYRGLDEVLVRPLGFPGGAMLAKHALAMIAAANMLALVESTRPRPVRRRVVTAVLIGASVALYAGRPEPVVPGPGTSEMYGTGPGVRLHWAIFLGFISWYLVTLIRVCIQYRRQAVAPELRAGMLMIAIGSIVGFGYIVEKVVLLATWGSGPVDRTLTWDAVAQAGILAVCLVLTAVGTTSEALWARTRQLGLIWSLSRSIRVLTPLWEVIVELEPEVVLPTGRLSRRHLLPSSLARELRLRHIRRITEIRDGLLRLGPLVDPSLRNTARHEARRLRLPEPDALAEAVWVEAARQAKTIASEQVAGSNWSGTGGGGATPTSEARWLELVARAYADHGTRDLLLERVRRQQRELSR